MAVLYRPIAVPTPLDGDRDLLALESLWRAAMEYRTPAGEFVKMLREIDWDKKPAKAFHAVIEMCVGLEAIDLAREFAARGSALYPEDERLAKQVRVYAPAKTLSIGGKARPGRALDVQWMQEHSREYAGLWVAVQYGKLLGTASTRAGLIEKLGLPVANPDILIGRIP
jgi:hypothetical protein